MKQFKILAVIILLALTGQVGTGLAQSLSLSEAKAMGLVGEKPDGLIGIVGSPTPEIQVLVEQTNAGRMQVYSESAKRQNVPLSTVQAVAGKNLYEKSPAGHYILIDGSWLRK